MMILPQTDVPFLFSERSVPTTLRFGAGARRTAAITEKVHEQKVARFSVIIQKVQHS